MAADLNNLQGFDRYLAAVFRDIREFQKHFESEVTWTQTQRDQVWPLYSAVTNLSNAVSELVNANRS